MPKPKLKLAFCMGGGVSLGAFSGGALGEALRQILYAEAERLLDGRERRFSAIEVDAFMGASAGTVTLALMVRALAYSLPGEASLGDEAESKIAIAEFDQRFGEGQFLRLRTLPNGDDLARDFLAVARLDSIQRRIWVDALNVHKLVKGAGGKGAAGLLSSAYLGELSSEIAGFFMKNNEFRWRSERNTGDRRLLGDQVVFGATLTALHPMDGPAAQKFALPAAEPQSSLWVDPTARAWLNQGSCRAARVFGIHFGNSPLANKQNSWVPLIPGGYAEWGEERERTDINHPASWWEMISTAVASGAFPGAFDPVVLRRHRAEFGWEPGDDNGAPGRKGAFPAGMDAADEFVELPYVDGGVFNNEPVEETVRLCDHLDKQESPGSFERVVFFVDSSIPQATPVRCFDYQSHMQAKWSRKSQVGGANRRSGNQFVDEPELELATPGKNLRDSILAVGTTLFGHSRITRKTPVLDVDFDETLPEFMRNVVSVGPVEAKSGVLTQIELKGERLAAFGGFFQRSYRLSDFETGRLAVYDTLLYADKHIADRIEALGWKDSRKRFKPPGRTLISAGEERREMAVRKEKARELAKTIHERLGELLPRMLLFLGGGYVGRRAMRRRILDQLTDGNTVAYRSLQLVLPGENWELALEGYKNIKVPHWQSPRGEVLSAVDLCVAFTPRVDGPVRDIQGLYFGEQLNDTPIAVEAVCRVTGRWLSRQQEKELILVDPPDELMAKVKQALFHGALGVRYYPDAIDKYSRFTLYQPPNQIEFGLKYNENEP